MILVSNYKSNTLQKSIIFLASCGYAFPGTILAVGIVVFVGWLNDNIYFHFSYFAGGFLILIFAYTTRFLAVGNGAIRSGILRVHPNLMDANKTMGIGFFMGIRKLIIPLIYTNILVGGILKFSATHSAFDFAGDNKMLCPSTTSQTVFAGRCHSGHNGSASRPMHNELTVMCCGSGTHNASGYSQSASRSRSGWARQ